jgi:hypothetical protein
LLANLLSFKTSRHPASLLILAASGRENKGFYEKQEMF